MTPLERLDALIKRGVFYDCDWETIKRAMDELARLYAERRCGMSTESKHTNGPWHYDGSVSVLRNGDGSINDLVALVYSSDLSGNIAANARLIASAPELLEALELVLAWAPQPVLSEHASSLEFARSLISRVRGE